MSATRVPTPLLIQGTILFPQGADVSDAMAFVRLRDVTLQDVPSITLVEIVICNVDASETHEFQIRGDVSAWDPKGSFAVDVHVKRNTDPTNPNFNAFEKGDFINMQSYPVDVHAGAPPQVVTVEVKEV